MSSQPACTASDSSLEQRFGCFAATSCPDCFRKVYDTVEPIIRNRVYNAIKDADERDDLTSAIFSRVLRARAKYDPTLPFMNWLNRITTNAIRNALRDRGRNRFIPFSHLADRLTEQNFPSPDPDPHQVAERTDITLKVAKFLKSLPESFQVAFNLHHGQGMTYRHAGELLGERAGTVKTRAYRSCRHLENHMGMPLQEFLLDEVYG
jgi:RNA polymerase sigma-70 factor (ECF subfamily)